MAAGHNLEHSNSAVVNLVRKMRWAVCYPFKFSLILFFGNKREIAVTRHSWQLNQTLNDIIKSIILFPFFKKMLTKTWTAKRTTLIICFIHFQF